ncbi:hypothetical protein I4U23_011720 [Adineta vaga]|nr:hypothetical protein I4U23_011720 [Adineta vaga]
MTYSLLLLGLVLIVCIHRSFGDQITNKAIECSANEEQCGLQCYSLETHKCKSGLVCRKDEEGWCGKKCFNLTKEKCVWGLICLKSEIWCSNQCIDPTIKKCRRKRLADIISKNL